MKYEEALRAAHSIMDYLRPSCRGFEPGGDLGSIEIAGSLRRKRKDKDFDEIDLIMLPDLTPPPFPRAEFGKPVPRVYKSTLEKILDELSQDGKIVRKNGGDRSIKFFSREHRINVDLYIVRAPATWGVLFAIRTGPEDFSHWFVTQNKKGGILPDGYRVQGGAVWEGEAKLPDKELLDKTPIGFETEESFFEFLGLGWIEPEDRRARWGSRG